VKTQLYQWLKTNRVMLINAGSLVCTTLVTGVLGFAYWWVGARQFHPDALGLASAAISAMMLLGAICVLGLGTLLIGELPRQPGKEASLISTALLLVGLVGGLTGILFALIAPFISLDFLPLRASIGSVLIFAAGVSFTSITIVLDQALIGLLRGELQFWRNTLFAAAKLTALIATGLALHSSLFFRGGVAIYATWAIGNAISLVPLAILVLVKKRSSLTHIMPDWSLLRKLGFSALQHHMLNLIQQVPTTALPVLVTVLLSATTNAWFYIAWMISGFVFTASYALTTVLYAINTAPPDEIARKMRMTLNLALITCLGANLVIQIGATQILGLFGHTYAEEAAWSLRIVSLAAFPMIIKYHYIAVSRINQKLLRAMLPVAIGSVLELGAAALGARMGNLVGLTIGWTSAVCIEAVFMSPAVFKAVRFRPSIEVQQNISLASTVPLETLEMAGVSSSSSKKQETFRNSGSVATLNATEKTEGLTSLSTIVSDAETEETELLPSILLPAFYRTVTRPLPALSSELEMQKLLSISTSITDKHKRMGLPSAINTAPVVDRPAKLQQLPKIPTTIADVMIETQLLPKVSASMIVIEEKTQEISALSPSYSELYCVQCHNVLPPYAKFCGTCGKHLEKSDKEFLTVSEDISIPDETISTEQPITEDVAVINERTDEEQPIVENVPVLSYMEQSAREGKVVISEKRSVISIASAILTIVLPFCALILWYVSLPGVHLRNMTDMGLISVLPIGTIMPLFLLTASFCLTMWQTKKRVPVILLHILILIFMLYGITAMIEAVPRFDVVYRHAGYTEYIMRHGSVDPGLDAYFDWAGFFIFSAFLTKIAGYTTVLSYAAWSPFFLNLIYFFPLYIIFTSATTDKRIIWFATWFFYLTNWIGQDYFSPQGLNFFFYLVVIAILVKWFKLAPKDQPRALGPRWRRLGRLFPLAQGFYGWLTAPDTLIAPSSKPQRVALLASLCAIFVMMVFSHPLTPFLTIASVIALVIFRRCKPFWLPAFMIILTFTWIVTMAQPYLVSNLNNIVGDFSQINSVVTQNITSRALQGDVDHNLISHIRLLMTAFVWGLAFIGGLMRLRKGYRDATYVLLAIAPFPVLLVQSYGGEMLLRIYLFTLPMMTFFMAAIFFTPSSRKGSLWMKGGILIMSFVLLGAFFFTRYGNENMDYMTPQELAGVHYLYTVAPTNSLFLEAWDGTPWESQGFELYNTSSLAETIPDAVQDYNVNAIIQYIRDQGSNSPKAYIIITRAQQATANSDGVRPGTLKHLEYALLKSKKFVQIYTNRDAQVFLFTGSINGSQH
jgi:O-antigen/teichoic acid export membrane protein